ncbi:hypothetical protein NMY22_g11292 [Coprinellus aureogranulatus]|nr:hypothetical protein NMY22_g11292 [Coprinellus aureogranulatus]
MPSSYDSNAARLGDRDHGQMLLLGTQCAETHCLQVDFLPFKCTHCAKSYCQAHYKVEDHKCPDYEEFKYNRVAPDCPFCHVPVAVPLDQDPNIRMELHFEKDCVVILGEVPPRPTPRCSKKSCNEVHCVAHRFPAEHNCAKAALASSKAQARVGIPSRPLRKSTPGSTTKSFDTKVSSLAADLKKSVSLAAATVSVASADATKAASHSATAVVDGVKTRRRAKSERKSQLRGMQARKEKGLLSEGEVEILAKLEETNDRDCAVM